MPLQESDLVNVPLLSESGWPGQAKVVGNDSLVAGDAVDTGSLVGAVVDVSMQGTHFFLLTISSTFGSHHFRTSLY